MMISRHLKLRKRTIIIMKAHCSDSHTKHYIYTYTVNATEDHRFYRWNNWKYSGAHTCELEHGDFSNRHYLDSGQHKVFKAI